MQSRIITALSTFGKDDYKIKKEEEPNLHSDFPTSLSQEQNS